jgi:TonB family protein
MQTIIPFFILYLSTPSASIPIDTIGPVFTENCTPPSFPGGDEEFWAFFQKNFHYPKQAYYQRGIRGAARLQLIVDEKGKVNDIEVINNGQDTTIVKAFVKMVERFPPLNPATQDGIPVTSIFPIEMNFPLYPAGGDLANVPAPGDTAREEDKPAFKTITEVAPVFPGGNAGLFRYLRKHIQYPVEAMQEEIEGTVTVDFTINEEGRVTNATTVGPKLGGHLELEALRLVRSMPKWKPGTNAGKPVPVACSFPLHFQLLTYKQRKQKARIFPTY